MGASNFATMNASSLLASIAKTHFYEVQFSSTMKLYSSLY